MPTPPATINAPVVVEIELVVLLILIIPDPKLVAVTAIATKVDVLKLNAYPDVVAKLDVVALIAFVTNVDVLKFNAKLAVVATPVKFP